MRRPQEEKCGWEKGIISEPSCQLERKIAYSPIDQIEGDSYTTYQIYSPRYFGHKEYPNNTYCAWNITNKGYVMYKIIDQQLQEPCNESTPDCKCPDGVKITGKGTNELKLCGSGMTNELSIATNGFQIEFFSDNKYTAKGFHLLAYKFHSELSVEKREITTAEVSHTYN